MFKVKIFFLSQNVNISRGGSGAGVQANLECFPPSISLKFLLMLTALSNFLANIMQLNPMSNFELIDADVSAKVENNTLLRKHSSCQPQAEIPVNWRDRAMTCPGLIQGQMQALYTFHGVLTVDAGIFFPKMRVICTFGV